MTRTEDASVHEFTLAARPPLNGYEAEFDGVTLREITDAAIVSIAVPLGGEAKLQSALKSAFGCDQPQPGNSVLASDGATRILGLGRDSMFAVLSHAPPDAEQVIARKLDGAAYSTGQSDAWVMMEMTGPRSRTVLERICQIDLHPESFLQGDVARTHMEHMGAIIVRTGTDTFLLLSVSSSAHSFLHALETSICNTTTDRGGEGIPPTRTGKHHPTRAC
jgi:heterotetrameric sarcosine oxidase gamma subunit